MRWTAGIAGGQKPRSQGRSTRSPRERHPAARGVHAAHILRLFPRQPSPDKRALCPATRDLPAPAGIPAPVLPTSGLCAPVTASQPQTPPRRRAAGLAGGGREQAARSRRRRRAPPTGGQACATVSRLPYSDLLSAAVAAARVAGNYRRGSAGRQPAPRPAPCSRSCSSRGRCGGGHCRSGRHDWGRARCAAFCRGAGARRRAAVPPGRLAVPRSQRRAACTGALVQRARARRPVGVGSRGEHVARRDRRGVGATRRRPGRRGSRPRARIAVHARRKPHGGPARGRLRRAPRRRPSHAHGALRRSLRRGGQRVRRRVERAARRGARHGKADARWVDLGTQPHRRDDPHVLWRAHRCGSRRPGRHSSPRAGRSVHDRRDQHGRSIGLAGRAGRARHFNVRRAAPPACRPAADRQRLGRRLGDNHRNAHGDTRLCGQLLGGDAALNGQP